MNDPLPELQTDTAPSAAAAAEPRSAPVASPFAESPAAPARPPMGAARLARLNAAQAQLGFCVQHDDTPAIPLGLLTLRPKHGLRLRIVSNSP